MLKSTAPPGPPANRAQGASSLLPEGWTEHKAPSGHTYYYNATSKQSTYTRPVPPQQSFSPPAPINPTTFNAFNPHQSSAPIHWQPGLSAGLGLPPQTTSSGPGPNQSYMRPPRREPQDRPKSKHKIPGCAPWLLVKTRLGRRFVHNPETQESFWKFPQHVLNGVIEFDIQERKGREQETTEPAETRVLGDTEIDGEREGKEDDEGAAAGGAAIVPVQQDQADHNEDDGSDEYEEVEVTEDEEEEEEAEGGGASRRPRTDGEAENEDQPVEFGEDDMAYQLAQMGQSYDLDPGEYGEEYEEDMEEGAAGLPMSQEEIDACFEDLLQDFAISPYTTWESVIEDGRIIEDDRYTLLPNKRSRKEVFKRWSSAKIQALKEEREKQAKRDPKIPYLDLLQEHATPKLFWPEFKRKFKKETAMKDLKLSDKEREKLYREHISRITKMPESALRADFRKLMETVPASATWNRSSSANGTLPQALLSDIRFISLKRRARDTELDEFIQTLPAPEEVTNGEDRVEVEQRRAERAKRDAALRDRQQRVEEEKRRQQRDLRQGRDRLQQEEQELQKAMKVDRRGIKDHLADNES